MSEQQNESEKIKYWSVNGTTSYYIRARFVKEILEASKDSISDKNIIAIGLKLGLGQKGSLRILHDMVFSELMKRDGDRWKAR
jgi:hypothetical protein